MPGGSADFLAEACVALRKLSEDVEHTHSMAMALLGPCGDFDQKKLSGEEVTELLIQVRWLQRSLFSIIGGSTSAAASVLKAKNVIRSFD